MRNFLFSTLSVIIWCGAAQFFLPWWVIAVISFGIGYFFIQRPWVSFLSGFLGVFLLWTCYAWFLSSANNHILAAKIAMLLPLKGNVAALLIATGTIGGLVGGLAMLSGRLAGQLRD